MLYQAHRGISAYYPENTLPAFRAAIAQGYNYIETDPTITADGVIVLLHDRTLARTCRTDQGEIPEGITIDSISFQQARLYDAGIFKGEAFRGTKIPSLEELLTLCENTEVTVKLDNCLFSFSEEQLRRLCASVQKHRAKVAFTCDSVENVKRLRNIYPQANIHYDGIVTKFILDELKSLMPKEEFTVWLCLPKLPNTAWYPHQKAGIPICNLVRQYAKLGLWTVTDPKQMSLVFSLLGDAVETDGSFPPIPSIHMFDCHTHTDASHDSKLSMRDSYTAARMSGLCGYAITDHCDIEYMTEKDLQDTSRFISYADLLSEKAFPVFRGIEIGEYIWNPVLAQKAAQSENYDIVIGSVHAVRFQKKYDADESIPFAQIDFSAFSQEKIIDYLKYYFEDVAEMAETADYDVLAHLTVPLRYICGKYHFDIDLTPHLSAIDRIFKTIIAKGKAVEVNISCLDSDYNALLPDENLLRRYYSMGGRLITFGSDAHIAENIAKNFVKAKEIVLEIGFTQAVYYQNRQAVFYSLNERI